jgi:hypothetical protein
MRRLLALVLFLAACPDPQTPVSAVNDKWRKRAAESYHAADMEDAKASVDAALKENPNDEAARLLSARIALARLEYTEALRATEGLKSTEAHSLRGRAFWYSNDIERAADELELMLRDPEVKDNWAREVVKLARRGQGRRPFTLEGGVVAAIDMPQAGSLLIVPCELDGENVLAMVSTRVAELTLDSTTRKEPAWVSMRFADRIEVKDIPAVTQDLSALSRQLGAPIKALLGVNLLRHLHATFDRRASQFVVRRQDPTPPPEASRVPLLYVRGGGMLVRAGLNQKGDVGTNLFVDTATPYPLALADQTWERAGVRLNALKSEPGLPPNYRAGYVPLMKLGGFELPQIPGVAGAELDDLRSHIDVDFGGVMGAGFLTPFRVTFGDGGRFVWLEGAPAEVVLPSERGASGALPGGPSSLPPGATPSSTAPPSASTPPTPAPPTPAPKGANAPTGVSPKHSATAPGAKP